VGCQLGRLGPLTGRQVFWLARTHLSGTVVSLVGGDPGVPMSHSLVGNMNSAKLYVLRGNILHGSISAIAAVTDDKLSKTNLWHMRLGI
jgi:hypothetical protein